MKFDIEHSSQLNHNEHKIINFDIKRGHLNGIFIQYLGIFGYSYGFRDIKITVKVNDGKRNKYLLNRMPISVLSSLSNYRYGNVGVHAVGDMLNQLSINQRKMQRADGVSEAEMKHYDDRIQHTLETINNRVGTLFIPLGSLTLVDKELNVEIECGVLDANSASYEQFRVGRFITGKTYEHMLEYDVTNDMDQEVKMVSECWAFRRDCKEFAVKDDADDYCGLTRVSLELDGDTTKQFTLNDALCITNGFGRVEIGSILNAAMIFGQDDNLPQGGHIEVVGKEDLYSLLVVRKLYAADEIVRAAKVQNDSIRDRVRAMEISEPRVTMELQKVGVVPDLKEVDDTEIELKESEKEVEKK